MFSIALLVVSLLLAFASPQEVDDTKYYYLNNVNDVANIEFSQDKDGYKWVVVCPIEQRCWLDCYEVQLSTMDRMVVYPVGENYETRWIPDIGPFNLMSTKNEITIILSSLTSRADSSFKCEARIFSGILPPDFSETK